MSTDQLKKVKTDNDDHHHHNGHPEVLGEHTVLGTWLRNPSLWKGTILEGTDGRLPPYIIVVGSRTRVIAIGRLLDSVSYLHDLAADANLNSGRVNVAVGAYKGTPIAIVETGMGCSSAEIISKEVLAEQYSSLSISTPSGSFSADSKYMIRVGSCAGINCEGDKEVINPFDVIVATHQVGVSGADIQVFTGQVDFFAEGTKEKCMSEMKKFGWQITKSGLPRCSTDSVISEALTKHAKAVLEKREKEEREKEDGKEKESGNGAVHSLGNFSKDSLYLESAPEDFMKLRETEDVGSSEMELCTLMRVGQEYVRGGLPVRIGMICFSLGTIPGAGFHFDEKKESVARDTSAVAALEALHSISQGHRS